MSRVTITAKAGQEEDAPSATVEYEMGGDLDTAIELFGPEVVYKRFAAAVIIDIQAMIRRLLNRTGEDKSPNPASQEEIQGVLDAWKPGVQKARKSAAEKTEDLFSQLSEEDKAALLSKLSGG